MLDLSYQSMRTLWLIYTVVIYCQCYDILKKNIDGKWFYAVKTNCHFSINMILIKAVFLISNHGVRVC